MDSVTAPLREEHRELLPEIERIRFVADSVGVVPPPALAERAAEVHAFLARSLIPHAKAEDAELYPVVGRMMGAPEATATMHHDHVEVASLVEQLHAILPEVRGSKLPLGVENAMRRILYGLYALVKIHFVEEEEIYLRLLDERLSQDDARVMFAAMEAAAEREKATLG